MKIPKWIELEKRIGAIQMPWEVRRDLRPGHRGLVLVTLKPSQSGVVLDLVTTLVAMTGRSSSFTLPPESEVATRSKNAYTTTVVFTAEGKWSLEDRDATMAEYLRQVEEVVVPKVVVPKGKYGAYKGAGTYSGPRKRSYSLDTYEGL